MANPTFSVNDLPHVETDVTFSTTGGTVTGGHVLEVSYLAASFPDKKSLLLALEYITRVIVKQTWPAA
jgi:hypothetical protein